MIECNPSLDTRDQNKKLQIFFLSNFQEKPTSEESGHLVTFVQIDITILANLSLIVVLVQKFCRIVNRK